jgi:hypothetical protein
MHEFEFEFRILHLPMPSYWQWSETSRVLGSCVDSYSKSFVGVEESLPPFRWSSGSSEDCVDLSVYRCSFFSKLTQVLFLLLILFWIIFFLGRSEHTRKISWISWNNICARKEYRGLGVNRLREFNTALLGKWCWKMLVDRGGEVDLWSVHFSAHSSTIVLMYSHSLFYYFSLF